MNIDEVIKSDESVRIEKNVRTNKEYKYINSEKKIS